MFIPCLTETLVKFAVLLTETTGVETKISSVVTSLIGTLLELLFVLNGMSKDVDLLTAATIAGITLTEAGVL